MAKSKVLANEWGALATDRPLTNEEIEAKAKAFLGQMTMDEKIAQMSGDLPAFPTLPMMLYKYGDRWYPAGENRRLDLPAIRFSDGPRGVVMDHASSFPVTAARGATWDVELEEQIGEAIGIEARAFGANLVAAVCINVLRHPAWGRAQETYGEDPYHLGEMGAALVRGLQRHVMACVKHFACNSIENTRQKVDVRIAERTLREVYLPHFERCVQEGAASIMSAYNQLNGEYCSQNRHLLNEILKTDWGFEGFVMSDFVLGLHDAEKGIQAGLDLEMPVTQHYGKKLKKFVQQGQVPEAMIDEAVLRLLRQKIRFAQVGRPQGYSTADVASLEHRSLARRAATEAMVLLKNEPPLNQRMFPQQKRDFSTFISFSRSSRMEYNLRVSDGQRFGEFADMDLSRPVLPLDPQKIQRLLVVGRLADLPNQGDRGSSMTHPSHVVTPLEGLAAAAGEQFTVDFNSGLSPADASNQARRADAVVLFVGYTDKDEGENMMTHGGDRQRLTLPDSDIALILTLASVNPRLVVVLIGSGVVIMDPWLDYAPAVLMAWYPGMEGGHAIADVLLGHANPSGKLPVVFPKTESQLPLFDNRSRQVEYTLYHGYRLLDRKGQDPLFPFGFGLSYTNFAFSDLHIAEKELSPEGVLHASLTLTNTGERFGAEVVQFYVSYPGQAVERPLKELKGFARYSLTPGESTQVEFELPVRRLAYFDETSAKWQVESGIYALYAGSSSAEKDLLQHKFKIK